MPVLIGEGGGLGEGTKHRVRGQSQLPNTLRVNRLEGLRLSKLRQNALEPIATPLNIIPPSSRHVDILANIARVSNISMMYFHITSMINYLILFQ